MSREDRGTRSAPSIYFRTKKTRLDLLYSQARERALSQSFKQTFEKLPPKYMKKMMIKLGASSQIETKTKLPSDQQMKQFRINKRQELRRFYERKRYFDNKPYVNDLDEVVIGCYTPGKSRSSSQIWHQYRDNYRELAYRTQKVLNVKKGVFY